MAWAGPASEGIALWKQGDTNRFQEVARDFRHALAVDPQNPDYHSLLGRILLDLGEPQEASAELHWTMGFHARDAATVAETHLAQGQCLELLRKPTHARLEYEKVHGGQELTRQAQGRAQMCQWPRQNLPHVVVVAPSAMPAEAAKAESDVARMCAQSGVALEFPILVYVANGPEVPEGRQQVFVPSGAWAPALARIVAWRIAPTHSTDPLVRHGMLQWLSAPDVALPKPLVPLSDLKEWTPDADAEAGAFIGWLVKTYGLDACRAFWTDPQSVRGALTAYHKSLGDLEAEWLKASGPSS
jgi:hypothetical protein